MERSRVFHLLPASGGLFPEFFGGRYAILGTHSCQYTSIAFGQRCQQAGVRPSMGSVGDAYDNALCESFFASLECELLDRYTFKAQSEARLAVFRYIEG